MRCRLPDNYTWLRRATVRAAVRSDLAPVLADWVLARRLEVPRGAESVRGGRGAAYRAVLPGGIRAVVRPYRRGGVVARLTAQTYLGLRPRPLRELAAIVAARARGVAAAEVVAARIEGGLLYRGALVTMEVTGAAPLLDALRGTAAPARHAVLASAGRAVARLHEGGVVHPDLNLMNILVRGTGADATTTLVDFDRARVRRHALGPWARRRSLRRLRRSAGKLDPQGTVIDAAAVAAFRRGYESVAGRPCAC